MSFKIGNFLIGGNKTFIIAELSANHNQNYDSAIKLIDEASKAGADAIKLQTYTPDTITINCNKADFQINGGTLWDGQTLYDLYSKAYTPWEWHESLKEHANKLGLELFSSPFDITAVKFLEELDMPAYKIASCEITDHILIKRIAQTKKPVIISSGNASQVELQEAVDLLRANGTTDICMLKCTAAYPAKKEDANLLTINDMINRYKVVGGLSDHTLGHEVPTLSVAMGAKVIEKHFTLSRDSGSPDDAFSLTPSEFKQMVDSVREAESIIGKLTYGGVKSEEHTKKHRRSLFVVKDIKKGDKFTEDNLKSIRPGNGIHTKYYWDILGKVCNQDVEFGTPMNFEFIDEVKKIYNFKSKNLIQHELGYYEIENKPNKTELENYYKEKYYQSNYEKGQYQINYNQEELEYINNYSKRIYDIIKDNLEDKTFLDIGCGEGYTLNNFKNLGFDVLGLDFSDFGITNHNNSLLNNFMSGDIFNNIDILINDNKKFGLINLQNVLEHVIEPIQLMMNIKKLLTKNGILVIRVPNDFSRLQNYLLEQKYIDSNFWVAPPDHLSYFNLDNLKNLCKYCDYELFNCMSDYPIDFDLLEENTNYIKHNVGKMSHLKRIRVENFMCNISISKTNSYYKKLCELGCGREIIIFTKLL
uniref:AFP-like domain-containing protein n=1 Tax=viral metagenome TaxID=1070528 RepID=A0A6C0E546_9ZZZZ